MITEATGDYFWALSPFFFFIFLKGRSRVWLTSRPSWTGWPASKTPWFQLTTSRRQRTKREGNRNGCILLRVNTLEKIYKSKIPIFVHVSINKKHWPNSQGLFISRHTVVSPGQFGIRRWDGKITRWKWEWDGKCWRLGAFFFFFFCPLFHFKSYFCEGCQFVEMCAHSLAASLMLRAAGPPSYWVGGW